MTAPSMTGIVRRFCDHPLRERGPHGWDRPPCLCGLPRPVSRWTVAKLARLRQLMHEHGSVAIAARLLDERVHDCDIALAALMGRTPAHALAAIEAALERS